ncbi:MAG TPA: hypothetical protein VJ482_02730 [Acidimicrobiia bacterium]|nr:hypothetical protein [Acidimicrobiia bacterium]
MSDLAIVEPDDFAQHLEIRDDDAAPVPPAPTLLTPDRTRLQVIDVHGPGATT